MIFYDKLAVIAEDCGFTNYAELDISTLDFMQEIRDMCNAQQCNSYNKSWSCPPACPSLEDMQKKALQYSTGILVQTVGDLEDGMDWDNIMEAGERHKENFGKMRETLNKNYSKLLALGAGVCKICETCTYPENPCRYHDKMEISMEACGLYVSKICKDNNLPYNYGTEKVAFTSCFLV